MKTFNYRWEWRLRSAPEEIWPYLADTNSFNQATGLPALERISEQSKEGTQRLRFKRLGVTIEWDEEPFEWVRPNNFGVVRRYHKGPVKKMTVRAELHPLDGGGTHFIYSVDAEPANVLGLLAIPVQIGMISAKSFAKVFLEYDEIAQQLKESAAKSNTSTKVGRISLAPGAKERITTIKEKLQEGGIEPDLTDKLVRKISSADEMDLVKMRPYVLADEWDIDRKDALNIFLQATRAGLVNFNWDILCPLCRGAKKTVDSLNKLVSNVHCEACNIDFSTDFSRSVEITFYPNTSIRDVQDGSYCIGGPQVTPHIVLQQYLQPQEQKEIPVFLEKGLHRLRVLDAEGSRYIRVSDSGEHFAKFVYEGKEWPEDETVMNHEINLSLLNKSARRCLFILEKTEWADYSVTAADVTRLQIFRDLFSGEALRPGDQISVGSITILFTDLKNSTVMYREIGDATAFGKVMSHFDVLRDAIVAEDGAIVKTIGDAVMGVFKHPLSALKAMLTAQHQLGHSEGIVKDLSLKAGIHYGPAIAVTLNDKFDYFGTTVNMAARLEGFSKGSDIIISDDIYNDPEVLDFVRTNKLQPESFEANLKGFEEERFILWRVKI